MDHFKISECNSCDQLDNKLDPNSKAYVEDSIDEHLISVNEDESNLEQAYDPEAFFWYNVLYVIGSHVIYNAKLLQSRQGDLSNNSMKTPNIFKSEVSLDDPLTKIFCGYWILYTIANITEPDDQRPSSVSVVT